MYVSHKLQGQISGTQVIIFALNPVRHMTASYRLRGRVYNLGPKKEGYFYAIFCCTDLL